MNGHLDLEQRISRSFKLFKQSMVAFQEFANAWNRLSEKYEAGQKIRLNEVKEYKRLMARAMATNRSANAATRAFAGKHMVYDKFKFVLLSEVYFHYAPACVIRICDRQECRSQTIHAHARDD